MRAVLLPTDMAELWTALAEHPRAALYAGGTDLLVALRAGRVNAEALICLERLAELKQIRQGQGHVFLGAGLTMQALLDSDLVRARFGVLAQAASVLGSPAIRHMATLGGNLVTASPAGDTLPALHVLGAEVEVWSEGGQRREPVAEFITGPGRTSLAPGEMVGGVWLPTSEGLNLHHYEKVGQRQALAISMASLAVAGRVGADGVVQSVRLAWGSVGPKILCSDRIDQVLVGRRRTVEALREVGRTARDLASPIDDIRASREYRLALTANLPLRLAE